MSRFRLDRAWCVDVVQPMHKLLRVPRAPRVPILMYHGIRDDAGPGHPYYDTHTSPDVFAAHMDHLRREGYTTVDLERAVEIVSKGSYSSKVVAITFDDGYLDFYSSAFPVLLQCGFTATVFVVPGFLQPGGDAERRRLYMGWRELREIRRFDMRIGSHSMTHTRMHQLSTEQIDIELHRSRQAIEDKLGCEVPSFSYPYSFPEHDRRFVQLMRNRLLDNGYRHAVSTILGSAGRSSDRFLLPRLPVNVHDDLRLLDAKLEGAYDWMHTAQSARKFFSQINRATFRHAAPATTAS